MYATFIGLLIMQVTSCDKDSDKDKAQVSVRMTDAPPNYEAVMVDVQAVEITGSGEGAVMLNTKAGLEFQP